MAVVEPAVFRELNCLESGDFQEFSKVGLYIFKFRKQGQSVYVIIDDLIPCLKDGNDQSIPLFAKCENNNLFWAPLIEKAYAKLHQRYFALGGGSTAEALYDLTGMLVETCFIDGDQMTSSNSLYNSLKILCQKKCLIGARYDMEMFPVMKEKTKQALYAEAEG